MKNPEFSDDMVEEMLKVLPVKSVVRFRCVCKSWDSMITDPLFAKSHRHPTSGLLLYYMESNSFKTINCDDYELVRRKHPLSAASRNSMSTHKCRIWGSCNGFVCLGYYDEEGPRNYKLNLWNPSTGEVILLPDADNIDSPMRSFFGFGWDSNIGDYKVVRIMHRHSHQWVIDVLSLRTKTWARGHGPLVNFDLYRSSNSMIFCDGALHWLASGSMKRKKVVGFDLAEEKFRMPLPLPNHLDLIPYVDLCVIRDNDLCLTTQSLGSLCVDIWVMKDVDEYGVKSFWTKLVTVFLSSVSRVVIGGEIIGHFDLLHLSNDGEAIATFRTWKSFHEQVVRKVDFNLNGQTSVVISEGQTCILYKGNLQNIRYEETLASYVLRSRDRCKLQKH